VPTPPAPVTPPSDTGLTGEESASGPGATVLINESTPVNVGGALIPYTPDVFTVVELSATTTVEQNGPLIIKVDATSAAVAVTLPETTLFPSKFCYIVKSDSSANNVTISINASDTWYGATGAQTLASQYKSVLLLGVKTDTLSGWYVVATL